MTDNSSSSLPLLGRNQTRKVSEDRDASPDISEFAPEPEDTQSHGLSAHRTISATSIAVTEQCALRSAYKLLGKKKLPPSPFQESIMSDGRTFEKLLCEKTHQSIWISRLNKELSLKIPEDTEIKKCKEIRIRRDESPEAFQQRVSNGFQSILGEIAADLSCYRIYHEPSLARWDEDKKTLLSGKPDLLIWDGTNENWIIGDFKCSESAKITHGLQIAHYRMMLEKMLQELGEATSPIRDTAFVVHCAPGFRLDASDKAENQKEDLEALEVTGFQLSAIEPLHTKHLDFLTQFDTGNLHELESTTPFTALCNECEYRNICFPRFLKSKDKTPISLYPFRKAELGVVQGEFTSLEELETDLTEAHKDQLGIVSPLLSRHFTNKVRKATSTKGYNSFRAPIRSIENPIFFVSEGNEVKHQIDSEINGTCLVTFTRPERNRAWAYIFSDQELKNRCENIREFILLDLCRENLHMPLPTYTLSPLARFLEQRNESTLPDFSWADRLDNEDQDPETIDQRILNLRTVWSFLLENPPVEMDFQNQ